MTHLRFYDFMITVGHVTYNFRCDECYEQIEWRKWWNYRYYGFGVRLGSTIFYSSLLCNEKWNNFTGPFFRCKLITYTQRSAYTWWWYCELSCEFVSKIPEWVLLQQAWHQVHYVLPEFDRNKLCYRFSQKSGRCRGIDGFAECISKATRCANVGSFWIDKFNE